MSPIPLLVVASLAFSLDGRVADFRLPDTKGASHSLADALKDSRVVAIAFLGTECPLSQKYEPRLAELAREWAPKGVGFFGINANAQDTLEEIARDAKLHDLPFPVLKDAGAKIAEALSATRTPEVFVIDRDRMIRYQGRIDDRFAIDAARPQASESPFSNAIAAVLAGEPVPIARTPVSGCLIGKAGRPSDKGAAITYAGHAAAIFNRHCVSCHRDGQIAPFDLSSYENAEAWSGMIREVVEAGRMPPWDASPRYGKFSNEARLSDDEKRTLIAWAEAGAPEGERSKTPPKAEFPPGWRIPKPDLVVSLPEAIEVPATGEVRYQYVKVDPGFKRDVWIKAAEAKADNPRVVHHILVFVEPPENEDRDRRDIGSNWVAVGVPGGAPWVAPQGLARLIPAGSKLIFQLHYTPDGRPERDQSKLGLVFADEKDVKKELRSAIAMNRNIAVPPGSADYSERAGYRFGQDMLLYSLGPHMHLRGKAFRVEERTDAGASEILLDIPAYRFNWQNLYRFESPRLMHEGTNLICEGWFDNSKENPNNPDPSIKAVWGDQTWEEMLVCYFDVALVEQDLSIGYPKIGDKVGETRKVTFRYSPPKGSNSVHVAGEFNDWKTDANPLAGPDERGGFEATLELKPGRYEYKFVIDGKTWKHDPGNRRQAGFYNNSVLIAPE